MSCYFCSRVEVLKLLAFLLQIVFIQVLKFLECNEIQYVILFKSPHMSVPPSAFLHQCKLKLNRKTLIIIKIPLPPAFRSLVKLNVEKVEINVTRGFKSVYNCVVANSYK